MTLAVSELAECEAVIERGLQTFVDVGNALMRIRDGRLYGALYDTFEEYCRDRWDMSRSYAHRMIDAAVTTGNLLPIGNIPKSESVIRPITSLPPDMQQRIWQEVTEGVSNGRVTAAIVQDAVNKYRYKEATIAPALSGKYRVLYADPPWAYGNTMPDYFTEQSDHYPLMSVREIAALPVRDIALDDAVLFLWVTSPILAESFGVIDAWGFSYKSSFVWDKVKHNMGHYNSVRHELLLICTRGSCQPDVQKLFDSVQSIERTAHSVKPEEFRTIIDTIYPQGPRVELFARRKVEGWDTWGNDRTLQG